MKMQDKVALVTGAALGYRRGGSSIGSAIAFKFAAEGAKLVVVDVLAKMGQKTVDKIRENGSIALFVQADVSKNEVQRAIEMTKREFGKLNCLVNCAASYQADIFRNVVYILEEDWNHIALDSSGSRIQKTSVLPKKSKNGLRI